MHTLKTFVTLLYIFIQVNSIQSEKDVKSSLTFVIDNSGSMMDDIRQIKDGIDAILDAILESKESQIANFVLVTFNDPDVKTHTITQDKNAFKHALNAVSVAGGSDCPEYSLTGIEEALRVSLPGSYLYVFTDATAKDYKDYNNVTDLAQIRGSQVNFLLTGTCNEANDDAPGYKEYYDLSRFTNGQVFYLYKNDIKDVMSYITETVKGRRVPLVRAEFPKGTHYVHFVPDSFESDIIISVSGKKPKLNITDLQGVKYGHETLVDKENIAIFSMKITNPAIFTVTVESESKSSVLVTAKTKVGFRYAFSTFIPTSVDDAPKRPESGVKSYLSIQLIEADNIELKTIKLKDVNYADITEEIPFTVIDEQRKLYVTELIDIPKDLFKISVTSYNNVNEEYIVRESPTLIEALL